MNFVEEFILFIFALLAMITLNCKFSYGQDYLTCTSNLPQMISSQYIFIGENHFDEKPKDFFTKYTKQLKSLGFNTVFVEYIESKDQYFLDLYNHNPSEENRNRVYSTYGPYGDWGYNPEKYLKITDSFSENNIEIRGLDRRSDLRINLDLETKTAIRDEHMFEIAKEFIIKNPDKKIIFYNGSDHSFNNTHLSQPNLYQLISKFINDPSKITNIKFDLYDQNPSRERIQLSQGSLPDCANDMILYKPEKSSFFEFYIFENSKNLLPTLDTNSITKI